MTKLGKISEENLTSRERLNGDIVHPPEVLEVNESPEEKVVEEDHHQPVNNSVEIPKSPNTNKETTEVTEEKSENNEKVVEAETHSQPDENSQESLPNGPSNLIAVT